MNQISDFVQTLKSLQAVAQTATSPESLPEHMSKKIDAQYEKFIEDKKNAERAVRRHKKKSDRLQRQIKEELEPQQKQQLAKINQLKAKAQVYEDTLQERNSRIGELEMQRNASRAEAERHQQNCHQVQNKAKRLQRQIKEELEMQQKQQLAEINQLKAKVETFKSALQASSSHIGELEAQRNASHQAQNKAKHLQRQIKEELEPQQKQQLAEINQLKAREQVFESVLQARNSRIRELEGELDASRVEANHHQQNTQNKVGHLQRHALWAFIAAVFALLPTVYEWIVFAVFIFLVLITAWSRYSKQGKQE